MTDSVDWDALYAEQAARFIQDARAARDQHSTDSERLLRAVQSGDLEALNEASNDILRRYNEQLHAKFGEQPEDPGEDSGEDDSARGEGGTTSAGGERGVADGSMEDEQA